MVKIPETPLKYLQYRFNDACEILELGFTRSSGHPQYGLYLCALGVGLPLGAADLDVDFVGIGGGQLFGLGDGDGRAGSVRHTLRSKGVLVRGEEQVGWGDCDPDNERTLSNQPRGVLSTLDLLLAAVTGGLAPAGQSVETAPSPGYLVSNLHYLHLGNFGAVCNIRYLEPLDFLAGIFCLDPFQDDGNQPGRFAGLARGLTATEARALAAASKPSPPKIVAHLPADEGPVPLPAAEEPKVPEPPAARASLTVLPEAKLKPPAERPSTPPALKTTIVKHGDTLSGIARREYGSPAAWRLIFDANRQTLEDPDRISVGMELQLPPSPVAASVKTRTVKAGDTLYGIAVASYGDGRRWKAIYDVNAEQLKLKTARDIRPGMVLTIP